MNVDVDHLIAAYGYWGIAGVVGLESMGVPLPGETVLVAAATWAGLTDQLRIEFVIAGAAAGAIVGDFSGFLIGRQIGFPVLSRYGHHIGLTEPRLKLGQYLFLRHGGKVVFFGRFVAILRTLAAFLAGVNRMPPARFLLFNASGGIVWATVFGLGGYVFGTSLHHATGQLGIALLVLGVTAAVAGVIFLRRHEQRLLVEAERALPGHRG